MELEKMSTEELIAELKKSQKENAKLEKQIAKTEYADSLTAKIAESERERASEKRTLLIPEDFDPELSNTWQCSLNGKIYLVPKGVATEVPLAVYEIYQDQVSNEKKAIAGLRKAGS